MASRRTNDSWENQWVEKYGAEYALELVLLILIFGVSVFLRLATLTFQKGKERNG